MLSILLWLATASAMLIPDDHTEYLCTWEHQDYYHTVHFRAERLQWIRSNVNDTCSLPVYRAQCAYDPMTNATIHAMVEPLKKTTLVMLQLQQWYLYQPIPLVPGTYESTNHHEFVRHDGLCVPSPKPLRFRSTHAVHRFKHARRGRKHPEL